MTEQQTISPIQKYEDMVAIYGNPGDEKNQVLITLPYKHKLSWPPYQTVSKIKVHKLIADSVIRVLKKVLEHYGLKLIKELGLDIFGGSFNHRKQRGGSELSTHSWGIALDYDPEYNELHKGGLKRMSEPAYDFWWKCWEDEGFFSLGREKDYDWMHIQAANPNK